MDETLFVHECVWVCVCTCTYVCVCVRSEVNCMYCVYREVNQNYLYQDQMTLPSFYGNRETARITLRE